MKAHDAEGGRRTAAAEIALLVAGSIVVGGLFLGTAWWLIASQHPVSAQYGSPVEPTPEMTSGATAADVKAVHRALHSIGRKCRELPALRANAAVASDVDVVLRFARRYPRGRFTIDDESGTSLSLLLVARQALRNCSPEESARIDAALPIKLRDTKTG